MKLEDRAITINSLNGDSFPVSIDFSKKHSAFRVYLTPISVLEIVDLIPSGTFLIFNVDANEYDGTRRISLEQFTAKYSSYLEKFDDETLLLDKKSIIQLLEEISHYNFCLIELELNAEIEKVIQIIDLADKWNETTVIKEVSSSIFLSSHDDCYLYVETNDENIALELIKLLIKILITNTLNCPINELKFNPKDLINQGDFSIVIPQSPIKTLKKVTWKIFEGTFRDFVYSKKTLISKSNLVYFEDDKEIQIEKV